MYCKRERETRRTLWRMMTHYMCFKYIYVCMNGANACVRVYKYRNAHFYALVFYFKYAVYVCYNARHYNRIHRSTTHMRWQRTLRYNHYSMRLHASVWHCELRARNIVAYGTRGVCRVIFVQCSIHPTPVTTSTNEKARWPNINIK